MLHSASRYPAVVLTAALAVFCGRALSAFTAQISPDVVGRAGLGDDGSVVLPTTGTLDERPMFATRRHPAIGYDRPADDLVAQLIRRIEAGEVRLRFDRTSGYLASLLEALRVPIESQSVVFSKTSLQSHFIDPTNPRALFYSDSVAVGFIRGAPLLELAAFDPRQGVVFYALDQRDPERPEIVRSDSCLSCHESRNTMDVPGLLARSMGIGPGGVTVPQRGNYISDHRSPLEERWGGWFVTGRTGSARHMGNAILGGSVATTGGAPRLLPSLSGQFDLEGYPSPYSDVAALMVFNHQVRMTNMLTRVGWEARIAVDRQEKNPQERAAAERLIAADARELVDYMLFIDEAPLRGTLESTSGFVGKFATLGQRDGRGRNLRQLDLAGRLMRYPCSYMIYSRAFDELPVAAKEAVYSRLWAVLSGQEKGRQYSKLSAADRAAIVGILLDTKPGLPSYFRPI